MSAFTSPGPAGAAGAAGATGAAGADATSTVVSNTQTGDYTLVLTDSGKCIVVNSASTQTVTIPLHASVAFPLGATIEILRYGAGAVNVAITATGTIRSRGSLVGINAQYSCVSIRQHATDEWILVGDLV